MFTSESCSSCEILSISLLPPNLAHQAFRAIPLLQGFENAAAVDADGAGAFVFVNVQIAVRQLLEVAVEIDADHFAIAIDDGRAGTAADGVGGIDEIERRREIKRGFAIANARGQVERRLFVEAGGAVVQAIKRRLERHERRVFFVARDCAVVMRKLKFASGAIVLP